MERVRRWRMWFIGRTQQLEPRALRDLEELPERAWRAAGPEPLLALVPSRGEALATGDVRLELVLSAENSPHPALVLDTGQGFASGQRLPLPAPVAGRIAAVVTLPNSAVALGLELGGAETFGLSQSSVRALSPVGAVLAHAFPQARRLLQNPAEFARLSVRALRLLRYRGFRGLVERLRRGTQRQLADEGYEGWARRYTLLSKQQCVLLRERLVLLRRRPTFSVLVAGSETSIEAWRRTLEALESQVYPNWEVRLSKERASDELRELVRSCVPSTSAVWAPSADLLQDARGDFVAWLEPGDRLAADALFAVAERADRQPDVALIYTDSDGPRPTGEIAPSFKPDWSPELLRSCNYIGRSAFFLRERIQGLQDWQPAADDVSQHDLLLRFTAELAPERICHLPAVLVHTRPEGAQRAKEIANGVRVIQGSLDRAGVSGRVKPGPQPGTYHVQYGLPRPPPLVTVVVPTRDRVGLLRACIESLEEKSAYSPLELVVIDNESREQRTRTYLEALLIRGAARVLRYPHPFNFAAMNNLAARDARGTVLCLLNNDVEVIEPGWLTEMVGLALQPGVGAVGAKLLYPDNSVQHAGTVAGLFGVAAHGYLHEQRDAPGYLNQLQTTREVAAVTAACMVIRRDRFLESGGFDEAELAVAFNDVDFCFRLLQLGYRNLWTPHAQLYHRESASRGTDERGVDRRRFLREEALMRERWGSLIEWDPYYSPNLSLDANVPRPAWPPRFSAPWRVAR